MGNAPAQRESRGFYAPSELCIAHGVHSYSIKVNGGKFTATVNPNSAIAIYTGAKL